MKILYLVSLTLVLVGALNWLLFGAMGIDLIAILFGTMPTVARIIYILVGLSGIYLLFNIKHLISKEKILPMEK